MCDNIDGAVTFIVNLGCSAINLALQGPGGEVLDASISEYQSEPFFQSEPVLIADACLMVFTVISYILPQRKDLIVHFDRTISANAAAFLEKKPHNLPGMDDFQNGKAVLLLHKFGLLMGYYADILFTTNPEGFLMTLQFLIEGIGQQQGIDEVIARGCVDTIAIVVTDADVKPRLVQYMDYIIQQLVNLLDTVTFVNFYDFMNDFIKLFADNLKGTPVINLMDAVVRRICKEQHIKESGQQVQDKSNIVVDKCCVILRLMVDRPQYFSQKD